MAVGAVCVRRLATPGTYAMYSGAATISRHHDDDAAMTAIIAAGCNTK